MSKQQNNNKERDESCIDFLNPVYITKVIIANLLKKRDLTPLIHYFLYKNYLVDINKLLNLSENYSIIIYEKNSKVVLNVRREIKREDEEISIEVLNKKIDPDLFLKMFEFFCRIGLYKYDECNFCTKNS